MAFRCLDSWRSVKDIPRDWKPVPFITLDELRDRLQQNLPGISFTLPTVEAGEWAIWRGDGFSLEISLGKEKSVDHLWIAVRGNIEASFTKLLELSTLFNLRGIDLQSGEFFDRERAKISAANWKSAVARFEDQVK